MAVAICPFLKNPFTFGVAFQHAHVINRVTMKPKKNPMNGDVKSMMKTFSMPAILITPHPALAITAQIYPPIIACEALLGSPRNQVSRPQRIALTSAAMIAVILIVPGSTISPPMVFATATPKINGPENSAIDVMVSAHLGDIALEEIMVATILLES